MYGIVLAAALTTGTTAADFGFHHRCHGCAACYSCACSCGCYGCYGCWSGCYACGCACYGCASYHGCWTTCGCYGCYGYCGGWGCSCSCSCYGCYNCYACFAYHGCYHAAPVVAPPAGGTIIEKKIEGKKPEGEVSISQPASVVVKADPAVTIKVNGQVTPRRSAEETYHSPALIPGRTYSYTVVAEVTREGRLLSETKEIMVHAGRRTEVDFTSLGTAVAAVETEPANVTVVLPEGASLTVNDVPVNAKGNQTFQTPKLEKGKSYFYTVKAEVTRDGKSVTETRRIDVAAGKAVTVDFTKAGTLTASR